MICSQLGKDRICGPHAAVLGRGEADCKPVAAT